MSKPDFDRAFAKTPAIFHDSIIEAFEKGESAVKLRHKITTTLSVAAALAIVVAVAAFAANSIGIGTPKQDMVFSQPSVVTSLPTPEPAIGQAAVYAHKSGNFYHARPDCSGMKNAPATTVEQAEADGKTACPVCLKNAATPMPVRTTPEPSIPPTATLTPVPAEIQRQNHWLDGMLQVYATENGKVYHAVPDCSGMQNAHVLLSRDGDAQGKQPCPSCIPDIGDSSFRRIFGTDIASAFPSYTQEAGRLGTYSDRHGAYLSYFAHMRLEGETSYDFIELQLYPPASGLDGELQISAVGNSMLDSLLSIAASPFDELSGKLIPLYLEKRTGSADYRGVSAITVSFDQDGAITGCSTVLDIDEETCYLAHWPMEGGRFVLPEIEPTFMPEEYVYCLDSSIYYHSDAGCSGMRNPASMTRRKALQSGKQACPVCVAESSIAYATPEPTPSPWPTATAMPVVQDQPRGNTSSGVSFGVIGGADGPTSIFITRPDEQALETVAPPDIESVAQEPLPTPMPEPAPGPQDLGTITDIIGVDFESAFPGYELAYSESQPAEAGSGEAAYTMWEYVSGDRSLVISLLTADENRDGVISFNFPDSAASFKLMKQAKEPLRSLYMKIAPELADGLRALTDGDTPGSRYLWDAYIHFNSRLQITAVELVYAFSDASTAHFSWNTATAEPRLYSMNWIG